MAAERKPAAGEDSRLPGPTSWARPSRTGSTTSPPTPAGCPSAPTTTPPRSRWPPSAAGGRRSASTVTRTLTKLLITADAGGSNGYRTRLWKTELAALAAETGLAITVCHFPPGTSKWNKIEHRLFSHISSNWRGQTLASHEVVVNLIAATITRTGLTVHAELDHAEYPKGIKISDRQIRELESRAITRHDWHGEWNYTLTAAPPEP